MLYGKCSFWAMLALKQLYYIFEARKPPYTVIIAILEQQAVKLLFHDCLVNLQNNKFFCLLCLLLRVCNLNSLLRKHSDRPRNGGKIQLR